MFSINYILVQFQTVSEAFKLFDGDGDGHLTASEMASAIRALGHVITDSELRSLMNKARIDRESVVYSKLNIIMYTKLIN